MEDFRLHDLRRTLGSYMAMGNQSLHMIGKVLGHKSPTATQIYSRFAHDPVRAAMEKAHADMLEAAGLLSGDGESGDKAQSA
jgi:integrase